MAITWNPSDKATNITLSNSDLTAACTDSNWGGVRATISKSSGKWYWEISIDDTQFFMLGIGTSSANLNAFVGLDAYSYGYFSYNGNIYHSGSPASYGSSYTNGDIIGFALDLDNGKIWWARNNVWQASGNPAAGTGEAYSGLSGSFFPMFSGQYTTAVGTAKFLATDQTYSPPTGFNTFTGFIHYFSGYVLENGTPISRIINLHDRSDGSLVTTTTSSGSNGYYYMETLSSGSHYIVCLDNAAGEDYNDLILGNVFPTTVSG